MNEEDRLLRTREVALVLGVSVSTIKRWVDSGLLRARRTAGRHRLIALSDALAFARAQGGAVAFRGEPNGGDCLRRRLAAALRDGRAREARELIAAAYALHGASALADDWVRPVMEGLGHAWADGSVEVYQEHQATALVSGVLSRLIESESPRAPEGGPLAFGATPEGDPYSLPLLLGELVLREAGWEVRSLGPNLPLRSLAAATRRDRPGLVFLSVNHLTDVDRFVSEYQQFYQAAAAAGAAAFLGGRALTADLRPRLVCAGFGDRMIHLAEFARRLRRGAAAVNGPRTGVRPRTERGRGVDTEVVESEGVAPR